MRKTDRVDKHFDEIVNKKIKTKIAEAFLDLEGNIKISERKTLKEIPEECMKLIEKKGESMKTELNMFIDSQIRRIKSEKEQEKKQKRKGIIKMKCPNCGETSRIREKDKYCHNCGFFLKLREPEKSTPTEKELQNIRRVFDLCSKFDAKEIARIVASKNGTPKEEAKQLDIEEISEKIKDAKTFAEVKSILTEEELIYCVIADPPRKPQMQEGDEFLIMDILKILGSKGYSVKHSLHLLNIAKDVIQIIGRFEI